MSCKNTVGVIQDSKLSLQPFSNVAVGIATLTLIRILLARFSDSVLAFDSHCFLSLRFCLLSPFFFCLSSKCHPPPLRAGWLPFCCPSSAWSWSSTLAGAGVNAAASLSPRRARVLRQLMRSTTSHQCWWEARHARVWGTPGVRVQTPAVPSVSGRHRFWMGTSRVWMWDG